MLKVAISKWINRIMEWKSCFTLKLQFWISELTWFSNSCVLNWDNKCSIKISVLVPHTERRKGCGKWGDATHHDASLVVRKCLFIIITIYFIYYFCFICLFIHYYDFGGGGGYNNGISRRSLCVCLFANIF